MNRRRFLRRALFGAGIVASGGGIDLLERIVEPRRYWPGADFGDVYGRPWIADLDDAQLSQLVHDIFVEKLYIHGMRPRSLLTGLDVPPDRRVHFTIDPRYPA